MNLKVLQADIHEEKKKTLEKQEFCQHYVLSKDEELKTMRFIQDELHNEIAFLRKEIQKNRKEEDI
jgi:hypothetical protein